LLLSSVVWVVSMDEDFMHSLIIAPTSVISHEWQRVERFHGRHAHNCLVKN